MAKPRMSCFHSPDGTKAYPFRYGVKGENEWLNNMSMWSWQWRLYEIALSCFTWKNLPEGIDPFMMEYWLLTDNVVVFFYDESLKNDPDDRAPEGFACLQVIPNGKWDMYWYPTKRTAYSINGDIRIPLTNQNSVLIFNTQGRFPMLPTLDMYAYRLAMTERGIDVNIMNQRNPKIVRVDDAQKLTFKNIVERVEGAQYTIGIDKDVDINDLQVLDLSVPYVADKLDDHKNTVFNEALTFLGIENGFSDKKERLIEREVMMNMGAVEAQRFMRLEPRLKAVDEINNLFDLNIEVDFNAGVYVATDRDGIRRTSGMQVYNDNEMGNGDLNE